MPFEVREPAERVEQIVLAREPARERAGGVADREAALSWDRDHPENGGTLSLDPNACGLDEFGDTTICTKIAVELKNQYVIGFESTNAAKDGKWRKLRLKVNPPQGLPRLNVRSKSGYFAPVGDTKVSSTK